MKKTWKERTVSFLLAVLMVLGNFPGAVGAEEPSLETEFTVAENLQSNLEETYDYQEDLENGAPEPFGVQSETTVQSDVTGEKEETSTELAGVDPQQEEELGNQAETEQDTEKSEDTEENGTAQTDSEIEETEGFSMPAFSACSTAENGVQVSAFAQEGAFPEGTTMVVSAASRETVMEAAQAITVRKVVDAAAVDISFYNREGEEIEPADRSLVHVNLNTTGTSVEGSSFMVVHVNDWMSAEQVTDVNGISGDGAEFNAAEFSIYAIIGTDPSDDETALERITYKIYDEEEGKLLSTQIVKTGDTLVEPQLPDPEEGQTFLGWFTKSEEGYENFTGFGGSVVVEDTNKDTVVHVFARYGLLYTVAFHDTIWDDVIVDTISGEYIQGNTKVSLDEIVKRTVKVDAGADKMCTGWALSKQDAADRKKLAEDLMISSAGTTDLYPVIEDGHSLLFDANDTSVNRASYTSPQYLYPGEETVKPEDPKRIGYAFLGWNTAVDGSGDDFEFGKELTKNTTVYAQWEAQEVTYNVVYWTEILSKGTTGTHDALDEDGSFDESKALWSRYGAGTATALTGSKVKVAETDMPGGISVPEYYEFYKSAEKEVAGDGATEVNVYFRLRSYEFRWMWDNYTSSDGTVEFYIKTEQGNVYADDEGHGTYSFKAVLGESVSDRTPVLKPLGDNLDPEVICYGWSCPNRLYYGFYTNVARASIPYYWIEEMEKGGSFSAIYSREMVNMRFSYWVESVEDDNVYNLYSTADKIYAKNTTYSPSNTTKYTVLGSISKPEKPSALMPDGQDYPVVNQQNVVIDGTTYAQIYNWYYQRRRFDLVFKDVEESPEYVANYEGLTKRDIKVEAPISAYYHVPEKEGYDFLGWYDTDGTQVTDGNGKLIGTFENEIMPNLNTTREAHWKKSGTVTVTFDPNGGMFQDGTVEVKEYEEPKDELFPADDIPELNDRVGYVFNRWVYADGAEEGKPFDFENTKLIDNVHLKARWVSMASVQVEYDAQDHGEFGDGSKIYADPEKHLDGTGIILRGAPEKVEDGCCFIGWQMTRNSSIYKAGSTVAIEADSDDKCIFTAIYDEVPTDAELTYHSNYPEETGQENLASTIVRANNKGINVASPRDFGFALKGYTFQGWSETADGEVSYQPGKEAGIDNFSENHLYAVWAINNYKLTVDPNGGTWEGYEKPTEYIMEYQETKEIPDPIWEGYIFAGWTLTPIDSESTLNEKVFTMGLKDTVLTAQWKKVVLRKETISTPANGTSYVFGEDIRYKITIVSEGTVAVNNVVISDTLTGDSFLIEKLEAGETKTFETNYTVTEADILAGKVVNVATAKAEDVSVDPASTEDPTENPRSHLTVHKTIVSTPAKGKTYGLGETIRYQITVTNDGNITVTDIVVTDELTGNNWNVGTLRPGETSSALEDSYTVTESDIAAGEVRNIATATGKTTDPENPDGLGVISGAVKAPMARTMASLYVRKTSDAVGAVQEGQKITYTIVVLNNGNQTISNIRVEDPLTGDSWTIKKLLPGESKEYETTHIVVAQETKAGSVTNTAKATGKTSEGKKILASDSVTDQVTASADVPATGDSAPLKDYVLLAALALIVAVLVLRKRYTC